MLTCTLDSGRLIFRATSSRIKMSGYRVLPNSDSSTSNWARVNVVLSRLCLRGFTPGKDKEAIFQLIKFNYGNYLGCGGGREGSVKELNGCCYDKIIQLLKLSKQRRYAEVCAHNNNITLW